MALLADMVAGRRLSAPLHVDFEITRRCQLRCDYCSAMPLGGADADSVQAHRLMHQLRELGVFSLLISGGEPTLHRDFISILRCAAGCVPSVTVNSNGLRLASLKFCESVREAAPNVVLAISVDAFDPAINNQQRGAGGAKALMAISNCLDIGLNVCVSAVITDESMPHADELVSRLWPRVTQFRFFPQVARNAEHLARLSPDYQDKVAVFLQKLASLAPDRPGIRLLTPNGDVAKGFWPPKKLACLCLGSRLYVDSKFKVFPCFYSASKDNQLGCLRENTIAEIWRSDRLSALSTRGDLCASPTGEFPARYAND